MDKLYAYKIEGIIIWNGSNATKDENGNVHIQDCKMTDKVHHIVIAKDYQDAINKVEEFHKGSLEVDYIGKFTTEQVLL